VYNPPPHLPSQCVTFSGKIKVIIQIIMLSSRQMISNIIIQPDDNTKSSEEDLKIAFTDSGVENFHKKLCRIAQK
jgi:hypothetical protein